MISSAGNRTSVRACSIKTDCRIMAESLTMTERLTVIEVGTLKKRREESTFLCSEKTCAGIAANEWEKKACPNGTSEAIANVDRTNLSSDGSFF